MSHSPTFTLYTCFNSLGEIHAQLLAYLYKYSKHLYLIVLYLIVLYLIALYLISYIHDCVILNCVILDCETSSGSRLSCWMTIETASGSRLSCWMTIEPSDGSKLSCWMTIEALIHPNICKCWIHHKREVFGDEV